MTKDQATALRAQLLAHRVRLLDHAALQAEADNLSLDWLHMVADVQAALTAVEEATLLDTHCQFYHRAQLDNLPASRRNALRRYEHVIS